MVVSISPQSGSRPLLLNQRKREEWIQIDEHRRAPVWLHYEFWLLKGEDGKPNTKYAFCKYCREHKYKASSGYGTSNASIHLKSCQAYLKFIAENPHSGAVFYQKVFIRLFAKAIMFHSYSLSIVEHEKLRVMLSYLQPKVQHCVKEHEILKATLRSKLDSIYNRICFTCDCWPVITKHGYLMLTAHYVDNEWVLRSRILNFRCLEVRKAIDLFATRESNFDYGLSTNEWEVVEFVCKFLEPFNDITTLFSGFDYPTGNLYLLHVVAIEKWLVLAHNHNVPSIQLMCQTIMEKYEKCWSDHAIILSVAVVLDPRFKLKFVKGLYSMLYVPSEVDVRVRKVYDAMVELYDFYRSSSSQTIPLPSQSYSNRSHFALSYSSQQFSTADFMNDFFSSNSSCGEINSKLDNYLNASLVANEDGFDVLKYWQSQKSIYPVLSRMAKDILAIPITSVASESSFSMGGRVLTKFRTSLLPKNVEAFLLHKIGCLGICKRRS
ncbi:Zinc finger BED domain-containing protein RICESLEEPER 2 [Bienertia sinuspersici]